MTNNSLTHYGVLGMKWGIRRTPEQLGHQKKVEDVIIGKSVGAKAKNYDIRDPATGENFSFSEGTYIQNSQVFAGKGTKHPLHTSTVMKLIKQFGGKAEDWQHCKGIGTVDYYGEDRKAEVHWFQESSVGKVVFKIKEWKD